MKAALFYHGSEDFPSEIPLIQSIVDDRQLFGHYKVVQKVRIEASKQRGRVSVNVRKAYQANFDQLLRGNWQLQGRIYRFLSKTEAIYGAVKNVSCSQDSLMIFGGFKLLLQEEEIYQFSSYSGADLIWLKTALRNAVDGLLGTERRFDVLLMVSLGAGRNRRVMTNAICDNLIHGTSCPWANETVPILEQGLLSASRVCVNSLMAITTNYVRKQNPERTDLTTVT